MNIDNDDDDDDDMDGDSSGTTFEVGDIVNVQARMQPGSNKPGGVARIVEVHSNGTYDVKFVLARTNEKGVDAQFITYNKPKERNGRKRNRQEQNDGGRSKEGKISSSKKKQKQYKQSDNGKVNVGEV